MIFVGGDKRLKSISIRMPGVLLERLRMCAAQETIKREKTVSINALVVELLVKGVEELEGSRAEWKKPQ